MRKLTIESDDGLFDFPVPQQLGAYPNGDRITLSFKMLFQGQPERVRISLSKDQAVGLLGELRKAVESENDEGGR
jgi:hypothetical protein